MNGLSQKSIFILGAVVILGVLAVGTAVINLGLFEQPIEQYQFPSPEEVVRQYFTSWNSRDWPDMYATISDGFKQIEPTAKDLATFRSYAESQSITGVKIISIEEKSKDGTTASVDYSVEFTLTDGTVRPFSGTFTLKWREGDVIRGWKLIHPYGDKIDTS